MPPSAADKMCWCVCWLVVEDWWWWICVLSISKRILVGGRNLKCESLRWQKDGKNSALQILHCLVFVSQEQSSRVNSTVNHTETNQKIKTKQCRHLKSKHMHSFSKWLTDVVCCAQSSPNRLLSVRLLLPPCCSLAIGRLGQHVTPPLRLSWLVHLRCVVHHLCPSCSICRRTFFSFLYLSFADEFYLFW